MAKQTFTTGQVLTAAQMTSLQQTAMGGGSPSVKTTSYVLVAADAGTVIQMNAAGSTTITVNTSLFSAGDSVQIQNIGAGTCTITAGTATVTTAGSLALSQWEGGYLYFTSASAAIFFDVVQSSGMTNPMTTAGDTIYGGASGTPTRLGVGTAGQVLTVNSGATAPEWATPTSSGITYSTWSPTLVNFTQGNGTFNFRYAQSGKAVFLDINITFGSTTTIGEATISLPVASKYVNAIVAANYLDAGTAFYSSCCTIENPSGTHLLSLKVQKSDATYTTLAPVNATTPFTWTTNDQINIQCVYEAA